MERTNESSVQLEYRVDDKPGFAKSTLLGFQNVLTAFSGIIAVPLIIAGLAKASIPETAMLVSGALLASGVCSILQTKGIGPKSLRTGVGLPTIMGTDFGFVPPANAIINDMGGGLAGYFGATVLGGLLEFVLSFFIKPLMRFFPPVVTGTVISMIGLSMVPVAISWVGGPAESFGDPVYIGLAAFTFIVILLLNYYAKGFVSTASVLIGMVAGYVLAIALGIVDLSSFYEAKWFQMPNLLHWGINFNPKFVIPFVAAYFVTVIETVGVMQTLCEVTNSKIDDAKIAAGVRADAAGSMISPLFGSGPTQTFSQNVGLIPLTRCASQKVALFAGGILIVMGFCPKLATLISLMPTPVLGGAGILMFGTIIASGVQALSRARFTSRNMMIVASALAIGMGITVNPSVVAKLPSLLNALFSSGISAGTIIAVVLNILLKEKADDPEVD